MLTDNQKKRYSRQIALAEIGQQGQSALLDASVLVIGAGGLGCPILQILCNAGIGRIGVLDDDRIELSNLHRQFLYTENDVGRYKAEVAVKRLLEINSSITIQSHLERLSAENIAKIFSQYDIIIDGCDNFTTRFLVNIECIKQKKILFSGAVSEWQGQVAVFEGYDVNQPCYRCFCPSEPPASGRLDCSVSGVTGALTSIIASHLSMQVIHYITKSGDVLNGKLVRYNGLNHRLLISTIKKDKTCSDCLA